MNKDYYEILNVSRNATLRQIKRSYRFLALKYHPDRVLSDSKKDAESVFKEISEAYQVLSDPHKRMLYDDRKGWNINQGPAFRTGSFDKDLSKAANSRYTYHESLWSNFEIDSKSKFWALVVALFYITVSFWGGGLQGLLQMLTSLILPLACIFFGEEMGDFKGWFRVSITSSTPGSFIIFIGWVLLLTPFWFPFIDYICSL